MRENTLGKIKRWMTFKLVSIAAQLHHEMFLRLCEVAILAKYGEAIEEAEEALRDAIRLEQEHEYDNQEEHEEQEYDTIH